MNFIAELINWYHKNKRDLPWRRTVDPYIIWLSEVILQQTRVDQGLPYFYRFVEKYPTIAAFAAASEDEILRMWQGLGYYSRGRNMVRTAQLVMQEYGGNFPNKYEELIRLKGIGEYTAAAISSFSANEAKAVVDGNVFRVLARYFGIQEPVNSSKAKKLFTSVANAVIDRSNPGMSNQAIMEFGALHCRPKNPLCLTCPLVIECEAFKTNQVSLLPVKVKKASVKQRFFNYIVLMHEQQILMHKRGPKDIWENLYEFPLVETTESKTAEEIISDPGFIEIFGNAGIKDVYGPIKHVLTHQKIYAKFIIIDTDDIEFANLNHELFFTEIANLEQLAQPQLIFSFIKKFLP